MHVVSLYVRQFRLFEEKLAELSQGINILLGPNAVGKTSLLEALYLLISGHSFRTSRLGDLIRNNAFSFYIEGFYYKNDIHRQVRVSWGGDEKRVWSDHTLCTGLSALPGLLPGVVMTPDDLSLIKGMPQERRDYLDHQISQVDPLYIHHLHRYTRAMRQRNVLLKSRQALTIEAWEYEMAQSAAYLTRQRIVAIKELRGYCQSYFNQIGSSQEKLDLHFKIEGLPLEELKQFYLENYHKHRDREMYLGATLTGPHKDDFSLLINGQEARFFASEGQQRTCVLALKFAEWQRLQELTGETPLMLIDDIGVSLDKSRLDKLWHYLTKLGQVIVTSNRAPQGFEANIIAI